MNIVESGRNYGWPDVMGYCDAPTEREFCRTNGVVEPIAVWTPTVAPCGIAYYSGGRFPEWANSLLVTTLKASRLIVLGLDSSRRRVMSERQYLTGVLGRLRGVCVSPDGRVFVGTSNRDGRGTPRTGDDQIVEIVLATSSVPASSAPEWWFVADNHNHTQMIALRLPTDSSVRLELTDIHARHSYIWDFGRIAAGEYRFELDTRGIPSGAYAATLAVNHLPQSRKFVIIVP